MSITINGSGTFKGSLGLSYDPKYMTAIKILYNVPLEVKLSVFRHILKDSSRLSDFIDFMDSEHLDFIIINILTNTTISIISGISIEGPCCQVMFTTESILLSSNKFNKLVRFITHHDIPFKILLDHIGFYTDFPEALKLLTSCAEIKLTRPINEQDHLVLEDFGFSSKISSLIFEGFDLYNLNILKKIHNLQKITIFQVSTISFMDFFSPVFQYISISTTITELDVTIAPWDLTPRLNFSEVDDLVSAIHELSLQKSSLKVKLFLSIELPMTRSIFFEWFMRFEKLKNLVTELKLTFDLANSLYLDSIEEFKNLKKAHFRFISSRDVFWDFKLGKVMNSIKELTLSDQSELEISYNFQNLPFLKKLILIKCKLDTDCFSDHLNYLQELHLIDVYITNSKKSDVLELIVPEKIVFLKMVTTNCDNLPLAEIKNLSKLQYLNEISVSSSKISKRFIMSLPRYLFNLKLSGLDSYRVINKMNFDLSLANISKLELFLSKNVDNLDLKILPQHLKMFQINTTTHEIKGTLPVNISRLEINFCDYEGSLCISKLLNSICAKSENLSYIHIDINGPPLIDLSKFNFNKLESFSLSYYMEQNFTEKLTININEFSNSLSVINLKIIGHREQHVCIELLVNQLLDGLSSCKLLEYFKNVERIINNGNEYYRFYNYLCQ